MADTVGTGMIARTLQTNRELGQRDTALRQQEDQFREAKRATRINEALQQKQLGIQERQVGVQEERNKLLAQGQEFDQKQKEFENYQAYGEFANKVTSQALEAFKNTEDKMLKLLQQREALVKEYKKSTITTADMQGPTMAALEQTKGKDAALAAIERFPEVKKIDTELERLQGVWEGMADRISSENMTKALAYSDVDISDMVQRYYSPVDRLTMSPEELAEIDKEETEATQQILGLREQARTEQSKIMADQLAYAKGQEAGAVAQAEQPYKLEQIRAGDEWRSASGGNEGLQQFIDDYGVNVAGTLSNNIKSMIEQINFTSKFNESEFLLGMPTPEQLSTQIKSYYALQPQALAVQNMQQDQEALNLLYSNIGAAIEGNNVDWFTEQLPRIVNYMTGGPDVVMQDAKGNKVRLSEKIPQISRGVGNNPLADQLGYLGLVGQNAENFNQGVGQAMFTPQGRTASPFSSLQN